jgi:pyruvate/2-oxoglutarate dehydrogenase complex dihydrolipoamide dehydrogenase (E3) component
MGAGPSKAAADYDVVLIDSGVGGYIAAIRAARGGRAPP